MSQGANQISTTPPLPGGTLVSQANTALAALLSKYSGTSAPSSPTLGQWWLDTSASPIDALKIWDGANWDVAFYLDTTNQQIYAPIGGAIASLASSATTSLLSVGQTQVNITGTTTITSFGVASSGSAPGQVKFVKFSGILTLTNSASLVLPGAANIVTAVGDTCIAVYQGSGNWIVWSYTVAAQSPVYPQSFAGFVNKFRNGTMDIWQRGTSITVTSGSYSYTADGWMVKPTGANISVTQIDIGGSFTDGNGTKWALQLNGATSITDVLLKQRIESYVAAPLDNQTVTFQARVSNSTGGTVTPTLAVRNATAQDNWAATNTILAATSLQACPAGIAKLAYTFTIPNNTARNGLEVELDFGNNFSAGGKTLWVTCLDIRPTPNVATGLNSNPPVPELSPVGLQWAFCQRYYRKSFNQGVAPGTNVGQTGTGLIWNYNGTAGTTQQSMVLFGLPMRAAPTVTTYDAVGNSGKLSYYNNVATFINNIASASQNVSDQGVCIYTTGMTNGVTLVYDYTASAEL